MSFYYITCHRGKGATFVYKNIRNVFQSDARLIALSMGERLGGGGIEQ